MQQVQHARGWSFLPKVTFIITLGLITAATGFKASAVDVFTDPVGFITLTAEGTAGPGSSPAYSFQGLGMTQIPAQRGLVTSVSGQAVAISGLVAGQYNAGPRGALYYIEDVNTNSAYAGFTDDIVSNDATSVYTAFDDHVQIVAADGYKIIPHWTIAGVFGATDQAGLQQGSGTTADQILIQNPNAAGQPLAVYYYNNVTSKSLTPGWRGGSSGNTDVSQTPLYNDQGVLIGRQVSTNLSYQLVGAVKIGPTLIPLSGTNNFAGNVYATSTMTLSNSHLYTDGNPNDSLVAGTGTTADQVLVHNDATGALTVYYYNNVTSKSLTPGWRGGSTGNTDQSGATIPIGSFVLIELQPGHSGFNWAAPAPY
jgi:hypothetical protein